MKIAITGKGGVGKTLLSASLSRIFAKNGFSVLAVDADPAANLAATLGVPHPEQVIPVSEMKELVEERTNIRGKTEPYFKLNPKVDDIPEKYALRMDNIRVMRMGRVKEGGKGCYCPESAFLKTLMAHLLLTNKDVVIMDMEAGIEHLGRGTAGAVDKMIIVVEPGRRSIDTAVNITRLAGEIGIKNIAIVGNKVRNDADRESIKSILAGHEFLGFIPYDQAIVDADLSGSSILDASPEVNSVISGIYESLVALKQAKE